MSKPIYQATTVVQPRPTATDSRIIAIIIKNGHTIIAYLVWSQVHAHYYFKNVCVPDHMEAITTRTWSCDRQAMSDYHDMMFGEHNTNTRG